jgi:hypothetical protein
MKMGRKMVIGIDCDDRLSDSVNPTHFRLDGDEKKT